MRRLPRTAGVQLHITSLPGGRLGPEARAFADWAAAAGLSWWQVLPLGPPDRHGSPYKSRSAFAGWPALLESPRAPVSIAEEEEFRARQAFWIGDWERAAGGRRAVLDQVRFEREWRALRGYAAERGVAVIGDMPLYVAPGSVDQRSRPELFAEGLVAGAPPDEFTREGQLWGNPVYDWPAMSRRRYRWWIERLRRATDLFDLVRIDHFRGLVAYWAVPAGSRSARDGRWRRGPGGAPLLAARRALGRLDVVAEDLGVITPPVEHLRERLGIPGMAVLQFLFAGGDEDSLPGRRRARDERRARDPVERVSPERILYTGTHDQDTLSGWWASLSHERRAPVLAALAARGERVSGSSRWPLVRMALSSPAAVTMMQMQDLLGLGSEARMNVPGRAGGNWRWQMRPGSAERRLAGRVRELVQESGRCG